jgi:hypothetical protein
MPDPRFQGPIVISTHLVPTGDSDDPILMPWHSPIGPGILGEPDNPSEASAGEVGT